MNTLNDGTTKLSQYKLCQQLLQLPIHCTCDLDTTQLHLLSHGYPQFLYHIFFCEINFISSAVVTSTLLS
jgi:hypothetical protein